MSHEEKWINETLGMAERIERVQPEESLLLKLKSIPETAAVLYDRIPKKVVWSVAASLAILFALNFFSVKNYSDKKVQNTSTETTDNYFSYLKQL